MTKTKIQAAILAATMAISGAHATNPEYPTLQEPQGKTQTIDAPAKEATFTSKELLYILKSIEVYKNIATKNPELATEIANSFYKQIVPKGTKNIDDTITLSNTALETTLLDMGFRNEDVSQAMAYFNKISTRQRLTGVINMNGRKIDYVIDENGGCTFNGTISGNMAYLMPKGIKQGSLKWRSEETQLSGINVQHHIYQDIKDNQSPCVQKFCKRHKIILKKHGLEIDEKGNLYQTNPFYDKETIKRIQQNNIRYYSER